MAEVRYCNLVFSPTAQCTGMSNPQIADSGWGVMAQMPLDYVPSGARKYAVIVNGTFGNSAVTAGTGYQNGMLEVCLGLTNGLRFTHLLATHAVVPANHLSLASPYYGMPFTFVLVVDSVYADPLLGTSWNPNTNRLCLWARTFRNGDPATYSHVFSVTNVSWLWFDLTAIASSDQMLFVATGPTFISGSATAPSVPSYQSAAVSNAGQWLTFQSVAYRTQNAAGMEPRFEFGYYQAGGPTWYSRVGGSNPWGLNPHSTNGALPRMHHGMWHYEGLTNHTIAMKAWDPLTGALDRAILDRWAMVAIRLDGMTDVHAVADLGTRAAGVRADGAWQSTYQALERAGGIVVTEPVVLAHQHARTPFFAGYGLRVTDTENPSQFFGMGQVFPRTSWRNKQAVGSMAFGRRVFQQTSPTIQWRQHLVGDTHGAPLATQQADSSFVLAFHPVKDPENVWIPPGTIPTTPTVVASGITQSAAPGSLTQPPYPPNMNPLQRRSLRKEQIAALYRRSWLVGSSPEQLFTVTWGPLPVAQALAVFDFLVATQTWAYVPPRRALLSDAFNPIAVLNMGRPTMTKVDHRVATVTVDVARLLRTG